MVGLRCLESDCQIHAPAGARARARAKQCKATTDVPCWSARHTARNSHDTHPLTHDLGAFSSSKIHAHDMTQQQAAAGVVKELRTEHQEDCAVLARPTPHSTPALPSPALQCTDSECCWPCNYFEQACDSRRGRGLWMRVYEWSQVFAQISLGLHCLLFGLAFSF